MKKILAIGLVAVLALSLLTACGGNNSTPGGGDSAEGYPDYWNDEIPKLNGTMTFSMELGENNVSTLIDVKNKSVIDAYIDSLISNGYEKRSDNQDNTHRFISYENGTWSIGISYYYLDGDNDLEVTFTYCHDVID